MVHNTGHHSCFRIISDWSIVNHPSSSRLIKSLSIGNVLIHKSTLVQCRFRPFISIGLRRADAGKSWWKEVGKGSRISALHEGDTEASEVWVSSARWAGNPRGKGFAALKIIKLSGSKWWDFPESHGANYRRVVKMLFEMLLNYMFILYYIIFAFCSAKKGLRIEDLDRFGTLFKRSIETVPRRDVENYMVLVLRRLGPLIYAVEVIYRLSLIPLTVCLLSFVGYSNVMWPAHRFASVSLLMPRIPYSLADIGII